MRTNEKLRIGAILLCWGVSSGELVAAELPAPTPTPSVTPASVPTEAPLSLSQCIQRAIAVAPLLMSADQDTAIVQAQLAEANRAKWLPELKLRVLGGPVPDVPNGSGPEAGFPKVDTDLTDLGPFIQARVDALQPIYTFGKLSGLKEAAQFGVMAKQAQEVAARNEVIFRVKSVYNGLMYLYSLRDFMDELSERLTSARNKVEEQVRRHSPDVTDIDMMRLDLFQSETDRRFAELKSGIRLAQDTLATLIGAPREKPVVIVDKLLRFRDFDVKPLEHYLARAQAVRPEIKALANGVATRRAFMNSVKADFFPSFFVGGFFGYGKAPDRQHVESPFLNDDFNYMTGGVAVGLEQKLSFHLTDARYDKARAEYLKAVADQQQAMQGIELQIRKAHSEAVSKRESVKAAENGFRAGRSWVLASTLNFGVGLVPVKDLLEAFVAYSRVKVGFLDTIHDFDGSLAELSKAVGEEVTGLQY